MKNIKIKFWILIMLGNKHNQNSSGFQNFIVFAFNISCIVMQLYTVDFVKNIRYEDTQGEVIFESSACADGDFQIVFLGFAYSNIAFYVMMIIFGILVINELVNTKALGIILSLAVTIQFIFSVMFFILWSEKYGDCHAVFDGKAHRLFEATFIMTAIESIFVVFTTVISLIIVAMSL